MEVAFVTVSLLFVLTLFVFWKMQKETRMSCEIQLQRYQELCGSLVGQMNKLSNKCAATDVNAYHGLAQADAAVDESLAAQRNYAAANRLNGTQEAMEELIRQSQEAQLAGLDDGTFPQGN